MLSNQKQRKIAPSWIFPSYAVILFSGFEEANVRPATKLCNVFPLPIMWLVPTWNGGQAFNSSVEQKIPASVACYTKALFLHVMWLKVIPRRKFQPFTSVSTQPCLFRVSSLLGHHSFPPPFTTGTTNFMTTNHNHNKASLGFERQTSRRLELCVYVVWVFVFILTFRFTRV